jgi:Mn-dependent DtxR family transcriptional regulator
MVTPSREHVQETAIRLLNAIASKTENGTPVFVTEIARDLEIEEGAAQAAFRYLRDKR